MAITPEQMKTALEAFVSALPEGAMAKVMTVLPRAGFADTGAGMVTAIVLAEHGEDLDRFEQVVHKGLEAFQDQPGVLAHFLRTSIDPQHGAELVPQLVEISQEQGRSTEWSVFTPAQSTTGLCDKCGAHHAPGQNTLCDN